MASIAELLENELKAALDVKNEQSLHNYVAILQDNVVWRDDYLTASGSMQSEIKESIAVMREGFRRMDERFEAMDKRFEAMDKRFEERFTAIDRRFDDILHYMDKRFEAVDKRFEDLIGQTNSRFTMMFFFMTGGFTILTVLMTLYRFLG